LAILDEIITLQMIIGGIILLLASELPLFENNFNEESLSKTVKKENLNYYQNKK
jgi:hypothetical protein